MLRKIIAAGMLTVCFMLVTACGTGEAEPSDQTGTTETTVATTTEVTEETTVETTENTSVQGNLYETIAGEYIFTSGAGGCVSTLSLSSDGSFTGYYSDSEMGETGDGYPDGTVYECKFSGKFSSASKVSDTEYEASLESLSCEEEEGTERIEDNMRFIAASPYGLDDCQTVKFYSPESKTSELPGDFISWCTSSEAFENGTPDKLSFWGIYNVNGGQGWFSSIK